MVSSVTQKRFKIKSLDIRFISLSIALWSSHEFQKKSSINKSYTKLISLKKEHWIFILFLFKHFVFKDEIMNSLSVKTMFHFFLILPVSFSIWDKTHIQNAVGRKKKERKQRRKIFYGM